MFSILIVPGVGIVGERRRRCVGRRRRRGVCRGRSGRGGGARARAGARDAATETAVDEGGADPRGPPGARAAPRDDDGPPRARALDARRRPRRRAARARDAAADAVAHGTAGPEVAAAGRPYGPAAAERWASVPGRAASSPDFWRRGRVHKVNLFISSPSAPGDGASAPGHGAPIHARKDRKYRKDILSGRGATSHHRGVVPGP